MHRYFHDCIWLALEIGMALQEGDYIGFGMQNPYHAKILLKRPITPPLDGDVKYGDLEVEFFDVRKIILENFVQVDNMLQEIKLSLIGGLIEIDIGGCGLSVIGSKSVVFR
jgi:hypothetical protein